MGTTGLTGLDEVTGSTSTTGDELQTFQDFLSFDSSVDALIELYEEFAFAKTYRYRGSPYWKAFREMHDWNIGEMLWSNLSVDFDSGDPKKRSILLSPDRDAVLSTQADLLRGTMSLTKPDVVVFVTGPSYDGIIERFFPEVSFDFVTENGSVKRLSHNELPNLSFRTYHPGALQRRKLWGEFEIIRELVASALR